MAAWKPTSLLPAALEFTSHSSAFLFTHELNQKIMTNPFSFSQPPTANRNLSALSCCDVIPFSNTPCYAKRSSLFKIILTLYFLYKLQCPKVNNVYLLPGMLNPQASHPEPMQRPPLMYLRVQASALAHHSLALQQSPLPPSPCATDPTLSAFPATKRNRVTQIQNVISWWFVPRLHLSWPMLYHKGKISGPRISRLKDILMH